MKWAGLLHLVIKTQEYCGYKVFRGEQARNKVPLLFLYVKMLQGSFDQCF